MQHMTDDLSVIASKVGLHISCEKMKVIYVNIIPAPQIYVGQQPLECITDFQYLCSYISTETDPEINILARLDKAASVFQRQSFHQQYCQVPPLHFSHIIVSISY